MSNQLRLILERYIAVQPKASRLSLPFDRNLGDITRYKYVLAHALPLRLERLSSEQPNANALMLGMTQPLGTIAPPLYFISSSLPLPLTVATSEQPQPNVLPLNMSRRLGTVVGIPITPPDVADDINVTVNAVAVLTPTANVNVAISNDDTVDISITAVADITPVASAIVDAEQISVSVTITATATLNPVASASATYDSNNPRLVMLDVSSDMQNAKLQGIDKRSRFEATNNLTQHVNADWQQSKLIGTDNQAQFEANEQLHSSSQVSFEQSKLIGDSSSHGGEYQSFIAHSRQLKNEQSKLVGLDKWFGFEAMAKRQIERAISGENAKLLTDKLSTYSEYSKLLNNRTDFLIETARLPFSKLRYVPPPLSQTVILKEQIIEGWECGSGALRHYVYNDELALPMTRRIADRGASSQLAMPLSMPLGVLVLSATDADAMETRPCKRETLGVNPTLDVTMCEPRVFGKSSGIAIHSQATLDAIAYLQLTISDKNDAYGQGVIFVTNSVSLTRSDDGREIKMLGFSVGIDSNSYTWSFSATVPLSELSKVDTALEQQIGVEFTCNGNLWRFILDSCDDSISFGESSLTIKGKSRAMLLAHPYATQRGFKFDTAMSARQIADAELNRNGVASGFTLDWQLAGVNGWNVPANTYSYTGKTPINSLQWIAEAAGGFINADMIADILHVLAHYPVPSWEWAAQTPSINLTQSLITSRSRGRINKPAYNGVTIYGENDNGIGALIKRTGTSGGYQPPMVTSDLMTDQLAAISRGKMILSDTGDIGNIGISMPLVADVGVLKPSTLIGVNDGESWVGMVRGTTITGRLSSNRALEVDQSIDVERHFDKG
ncbi:hypothetical protein [Psychrobacter sp. DAB_AL43B]|uniref:hypothetical protein n=1 Tax=Psychrobacter sp. DAB_AL43B TaxID=1028416 RepID=UPI0009A6F80A|nr:hypothetical protein [Psychrobacter sp. DAB_AL43B]SLJ84502.1 hypothetical protein DABAL43B_1306 [Psychrobacter sp. DAB_AL43B]